MILLGVLRGLSVDDALKEMEFTPLLRALAKKLRQPTHSTRKPTTSSD